MSRLPDSQPRFGNLVRNATAIAGIASLGIVFGGPAVMRSIHKPQSLWDNPDKAGAELKAVLQKDAASEEFPGDIRLADGTGEGTVDLSTKVHEDLKIKDPFGLGIIATIKDQDVYYQAHASREGTIDLYADPDAITLKAAKTITESGQDSWKITATVNRARLYLKQVGTITDARGPDGKPEAARADSLYEAAYIEAARKANQTPEAFVKKYGFVSDWAEGALWKACNRKAQDEQAVTKYVTSAVHSLAGEVTTVIPKTNPSETETLAAITHGQVDVKFVPQPRESQLLSANQKKFIPTTGWLAGSILHTSPGNVSFETAANCNLNPVSVASP